MEIYKKIAKAKEEIKSTSIKKEGRNDFSKYNYFTPEQVESLVFNACKNNNLVTKFDLKRNEFGEIGYLTIIDIDKGEQVVYEMATKIPEIKATNVAQQLGGCVTYSERYLKMTAFGIVENSMDFDDKDNSKHEEPQEEKPWLNDKQYTQALEKIRRNDFGELTKKEWTDKLFSEFRMKKAYKDAITEELNSEFNNKLS
jgi:hypothetical protein